MGKIGKVKEIVMVNKIRNKGEQSVKQQVLNIPESEC